MTTYFTGNAPGSQDPRDLFDNSSNLDQFMLSQQRTFPDRLGVERLTLKALEDATPDAIEARQGAETARDVAVSAKDAALIQAGVYATEAAGRAAVADGQAFKVQGDGITIAAYEFRRVNASTSTQIGVYPASQYVSKVGLLGDITSQARYQEEVHPFRYLGDYAATTLYGYRDIVRFGDFYYYSASPITDAVLNYAWNPRFVSTGAGWSIAAFLARTVSGVEFSVTPYTAAGLPANSALLSEGNDKAAAAKPNEVFSMRAIVRNDGPVSVNVYGRLFFVGAGLPVRGPTITLAPGQEADVTASGSAASLTTTGAVMAVYNDTALAQNHKITIREPIIVKGAVVPPYFDGSSPTTTVDATYSWAGTADASDSVKTLRYSTRKLGTPGVDVGWQKLMPSVQAEVIGPVGALSATLTSRQSMDIVDTLSADRTLGWHINGSTLRQTADEGVTWTAISTFPSENIESVMELANGELLVSTAPADLRRKVYVSTGYRKGGAVTFANVLTASSPSCKFSSWGMFVDGPMVLLNEYGPKAGYTWSGGSEIIEPGKNARYTYMSLDHGKTWRTIFDLNAWLPGRLGIHLHGVAYDKWWDRIWLTFGDGTHRGDGQGGSGTLYSDDLGATWHWAHDGWDGGVEGHQCVGIFPMEGCILFGSDCFPNGVHRIDRSQGKHTGLYSIEVAFAISADDTLTYLCHRIWQSKDAPDAPVFFAFGCEKLTRPSCIVATRDGYTLSKIWEDTVAQQTGYGLRAVVGPTRRGQLIAASNDQRTAGMWSEIKGPCPIY
ncbi:exo-alpha-sialidase [Comamonas sp. NyZ500]|uniref:sialidase family protein n=1 Tax=Comamonas sp. NyZ500 TaxID=2795732 RepID=UPI00192CA632|nr:sialidase family protein [Comamonas sp. NyZ500]MBL5979038.1 exo-alpha-sialidase [Comamonas sp. NyZ500]